MKTGRHRRLPAGRGRLRRVVPVLVFLCGLGCWLMEGCLSSLSPELTEEVARGHVLESLNQAVEGRLEPDGAYIRLERDDMGNITAASADSDALNRLKAGVLEDLGQSLNGRAGASVPVGSLTGVGMLNGRGFPIPVCMAFEGSADVRFDTEFMSAGVNQTLHRITMTVTARVYSQSRRFSACVEESTSTVLGETVVVGPVPELAVVKGN